MKLLMGLFILLVSINVNAKNRFEFYRDIYPIVINNCASCHNATTPDRDWLNKNTMKSKKMTIYNRVFIRGDMPLSFRIFGGKDRYILKTWLEYPEVEL